MGYRKNLSRSRVSKAPRSLFYICCEGQLTEKLYFQGIRSDLRANNLKIEHCGGNPLEMVERALDIVRSEPIDHSLGDQIWCVFDIEWPQKHPYVREALELAARHGVHCAISNPCFELWLLLHFSDQWATLSTQDACRLLEKHLPSYSARRKSLDYQTLKLGFQSAKRRAQQLERRHEPSRPVDNKNPSTSIWELIDEAEARFR